MQSLNQYSDEMVAKERVRDHLRTAQRDRMAWRANQAVGGRAPTPDPRIRHLGWIGRLISAIVGAW